MKKILQLFIIVSLAVLYSNFASAQCTNTSSFGSATAPTNNTAVEISTCNYEDEYNTISGVVAGETYVSTSDCDSYITVRSGYSDGAVVAHGWSPLTWTATISGDHFIHYNTSAACGTATSCCVTTLTCTSCPPPPDPCASIINISNCGSGSVQNFVSGSSGSWASNPCYSSPGSEQIYSFTPTVNGQYSIEVTSTDGSFVDYNWQAGSCAETGWTCIDDISSTGNYGTLNWVAGTTYYILLDDENTTSSSHSFYIDCPPCTPANATITQTCAGDNLSYDLDINVTAMVDATSIDIIVGGTTHHSNVGTGNYSFTGLTSGTTVTIVDNADATCIYEEIISMCDLCNHPSTPTDDCASAPLIDLSQPFQGSTDCSYTVGSETTTESCGISLDNDSWISFIAGSSDVEMDYTVGYCEPIGDGIQLIVFSGDCSSLVEVPGSCVNPTGENITGTWNFSGLTVGDTYYIRIDGYAGDLCDYYFEPVSGVVITPPNNACDDAIALNCGDSDIASNILADAVDSPTGCAGGGTPGDGVWYSFIGDGSEVTITTDNPGTNFDTEINIFEGPCTSLTCIGGDNDGGVGMTSSYTFNTTNGTEYFVFVDGDGTAAGQFEVSLDCTTAPPCDADAGTWD